MNKLYTIDKLGAFGEGVAHDGKTVFIKGALPGEVVLAKNELEKKSFVRARLIKLLSTSKDRANPPCPYFFSCGGCALQHLNYNAQLALKKQTVEETLLKVANISASVEVVPSPLIYRYRNKLSFPVQNKKIGLYTENSHEVVDISDCLIQREWNKQLVSALRLFMSDYELKQNDGRQGIRHLVAREKGGSICIVLVTAENIDISRFLDYIPFPDFALYQNINMSNNNVILGKRFYFVGGRGKLPTFHPASFYQVNDQIEQRLYGEVAAACDGDIVVDAYCGAGNLTLRLCKSASAVYGVEIVPQAIEEAENRAKERNIYNVDFICGDCADVLPDLAERLKNDMGAKNGAHGQKKGITVILDPPRKGVDKKVIEAVKEMSPDKIIYVSCNPATLARDLIELTQSYCLASITAYDMFPQTPHVETLVVMQKSKIEGKRNEQ